jgi:hypothetical protein
MTESNSTGPAGPTDSPGPTYSRRIGHPDRRKLAAVAVACLAVIATAAVAMGASPGASPFECGRSDAGTPGIVRSSGVEITAIDGSDLSLETVDGWTRTISVTSETEITRGGDTIEAGDLAVGDTIRFRQQHNDDGTFTITRIDVVLPHVAGTVTATSESTITVLQRDGTSATVHVDASTSFRVEGTGGSADLDDVAVGMKIVATGEQNADGSLDASRVLAGTGRLRGDRGWKHGAPDTSPAPERSADPG